MASAGDYVGECLIVNLDEDERRGSTYDVDNLTNLFKELGFKVKDLKVAASQVSALTTTTIATNTTITNSNNSLATLKMGFSFLVRKCSGILQMNVAA